MHKNKIKDINSFLQEKVPIIKNVIIFYRVKTQFPHNFFVGQFDP